jgi:RES domain
MTLWEFLSDAAIQLPIKRDADDFQGFVEQVLKTFLDKLNQLSEPQDIYSQVQAYRPHIESFCKHAKEVIQETLAGHPNDAYQQFLRAVASVETFINKMMIGSVGTADLHFLYRVRPNLTESLTREELFHIPFEKRHLVRTQRYSIPGLPCLYLSGSIYTCWAEMGRPPFHELHAAAFWLSQDVKVGILDFSNRPGDLRSHINLADGTINDGALGRDKIINHIVLWPLMAMCSIIVKHRESPFKPEYIFPQTVLQWVSKNEPFSGICYFSTHVDDTTGHHLARCNLVFPTRVVKAKGRCNLLRSLFRMTIPHSWELLRAIQAGPTLPIPGIAFDFEFIPGRKEPYYETEFGKVQTNLNKEAVRLRIKSKNDNDPALGQVEA